MYHQVADRTHAAYRPYSVRPSTFAWQMWCVAALGYEAVSLDAVADHVAGNAKLPDKPIVLTFDDGFQDTVENAVPILQKHGFTATFFLVAGLIGQKSHWLFEESGCEFPLVDWPAARRLIASGFECGSHTMTHPRLATLDRAECLRELQASRSLLEDGLGREVRHLAYPYGSYTHVVRQMAEDLGYETACTVKHGRTPLGGDLLQLRRIWVPIVEPETPAGFAFRIASGRRPIDWIRKRFQRPRRQRERIGTDPARS